MKNYLIPKQREPVKENKGTEKDIACKQQSKETGVFKLISSKYISEDRKSTRQGETPHHDDLPRHRKTAHLNV